MDKITIKYFGRVGSVTNKKFNNVDEYKQYLIDLTNKRGAPAIIFYIDEENDDIIFKHMTKTMPNINSVKNRLYECKFKYNPISLTYRMKLDDFIDMDLPIETLKAAKKTYVLNCYYNKDYKKELNKLTSERVSKYMIKNGYIR